jgi:hypothetical protein
MLPFEYVNSEVDSLIPTTNWRNIAISPVEEADSTFWGEETTKKQGVNQGTSAEQNLGPIWVQIGPNTP